MAPEPPNFLQLREPAELASLGASLDVDPRIADSMVAQLRPEQGWSYEPVRALMAALEQLAERDEALALRFMMALYPVAERLYAHDICDSIELWLFERPHPELVAYVNQRFARNASAKQRVKERWLSYVRGDLKNPSGS